VYKCYNDGQKCFDFKCVDGKLEEEGEERAEAVWLQSEFLRKTRSDRQMKVLVL
jgi:hypothetical protein